MKYRCSFCAGKGEVACLRGYADPTLIACPICHGKPVTSLGAWLLTWRATRAALAIRAQSKEATRA